MQTCCTKVKMETPTEQLTPRKVSLPTDSLTPRDQHPQLFSDYPLEGHRLSQQSREVAFLRDSTPAAREESVAASSLRSSGRTSSSSSSHADEEEDDDAEEHVLARLDSGVSSNEVTPEVFYPAVSHAAGGSRRFEDAAGQQDAEESEQAPLSQGRTSSQDARDSHSKRADAADDAQDRNGCFSSQKGTPAEAKQRVQPETAEYRARAALRHTEGDVVQACSSLQGLPCSAACIPSAVSPPSLQSPTSHTEPCVVDRSCFAGTSVAFRDGEGEPPLPDTSLTSSSVLSDCRSPETDFRGATCDSAEHSVYLQSYGFNQDNTCFLCATTAGFRVFTCAPLFEFMRRESPAWGEGCYEVAGMLFRTNVFALVSAAEQKKVKLWDDQKKTFIGELRSRQPVRNVCLGREILAVVTEYTIFYGLWRGVWNCVFLSCGASKNNGFSNRRLVSCAFSEVQQALVQVTGSRCPMASYDCPQVYVYQSEQMRPFSIIHTRPNPRGLCIITSTRDGDGWILACPAVAAGAVRVQTPDGDKTSHVFQAHQTPLAVMAFNSRGTWISTASETGTVIRIFCARDGHLLHELRRGTHSYAVTCLALRADDLFLAVASSSPTVHIFKLEQHEHAQQKHSSELINAGTAEGAPHPTLITTGSSDMRPAGICPIAGSPNRSEPVSSAARAASTAPAVSGNSVASNSSTRAPVTAVPLQQALSVGKELTSVVYDASKEIVNDVIKGVFFKYFSAVRSFAQFHVPVDQQAIDVRSPTSHILGPLCAFAGDISNHLYLLHPNGVFYEFRFDPNYGDECTLLTATTWFAPRPDFQIQSHLTLPSLPSELEGGHEGDEWQIVM